MWSFRHLTRLSGCMLAPMVCCVCICMCACAHACMCVRVCMREKETERVYACMTFHPLLIHTIRPGKMLESRAHRPGCDVFAVATDDRRKRPEAAAKANLRKTSSSSSAHDLSAGCFDTSKMPGSVFVFRVRGIGVSKSVDAAAALVKH